MASFVENVLRCRDLLHIQFEFNLSLDATVAGSPLQGLLRSAEERPSATSILGVLYENAARGRLRNQNRAAVYEPDIGRRLLAPNVFGQDSI